MSSKRVRNETKEPAKRNEKEEKEQKEEKEFVLLSSELERSGEWYFDWIQYTGNEKGVQELSTFMEENREDLARDDKVDLAKKVTESQLDSCLFVLSLIGRASKWNLKKVQGTLTLPRLSSGEIDSVACLNGNNILYGQISDFYKF